MAIDVVEEPMAALPDHARIPIVFQVERVLDVTVKPHGGGFVLAERPLVVPFRKDYDAIEGNAPARWAEEFDLSNWGLIAARSDGERLGGAVIAFDTEGVTMLEGRRDLAVLWDIRVSLGHRRKGVGSALFRAAEAWARARRCSQLKIETQSINVAACRFYASQGCALRAARPLACPEFPDEIQLLWYRDLTPIG